MASGPRSFNFVTLLLLLSMAAGGYWIWKFFPNYFTAWQVDHVLSDTVAQSYHIALQHEPDLSRSRNALVDEARKKVVALGVTDPEMSVELTFADEQAFAVCDYRVVIQHPIEGKFTELAMHRHASGSLKRVNWDNPGAN